MTVVIQPVALCLKRENSPTAAEEVAGSIAIMPKMPKTQTPIDKVFMVGR